MDSVQTLPTKHLARQLANILPAEPSEGFESTIKTFCSQFPGRIEVPPSAEALAAARALYVVMIKSCYLYSNYEKKSINIYRTFV